MSDIKNRNPVRFDFEIEKITLVYLAIPFVVGFLSGFCSRHMCSWFVKKNRS